MRVSLLNTYDFGGAATATRRIHQGLRRIGVDSRMLVGIQRTDEPTIHGPEGTTGRVLSMARVVSDPWPLKLHGGADGAFSVNWCPDTVVKRIDQLDPDVVHLNWIGDGFLNVKTIGRFDRPIVWRLPDMWAFTGGCHYADGCNQFKKSCGTCPKLDSDTSFDASRWTWRRKSKGWQAADITVVAPSTWLAERARESSLFGNRPVEVIPNGLDTEVYRPTDPDIGRTLFGLPEDKPIVLFGAQATDDPRKGFDLLRAALERLHESGDYDDLVLVVFGTSEPEEPPDLGFDTYYTGFVHDDPSLSLLYGAADVMVVPSKYEGFGQTVIEAMSCATPVVAFDATGPRETVEHEKSGYLAEPYEPDDLADGIDWLLGDPERRHVMGENARAKAIDVYAIEGIAHQYNKLYEDLT